MFNTQLSLIHKSRITRLLIKKCRVEKKEANICLLMIWLEKRQSQIKSIVCLFFLDAVDCEYIETESSDTALLTVAYVMAGVCGLCLLPIFVLLAQASCKRKKQHERLPQSETAHEASDTANLRDDF